MSGMKDTLGDTAFAYPASPGWKEPTTSRDAAAVVASDARVLREAVHGVLVMVGRSGLTADEIATRLGRSVLSVRPRVSELTKETPPRVIATGERRLNASGLKAKVWRAP